MKTFTRNNLIAALVLGALGAPLSVYAATEATVNITATVTEKFTIAAVPTSVSFNNEDRAKTVTITTTSNVQKHGASTLTLVSNVEASGKSINLKHKTATGASAPVFPVEVKLGTAYATFGAGNKATHNVIAPASGTTQATIMTLTPQNLSKSTVGEYEGTLTITAAPQ